ncbi:hypothetical protein VE00_10891 [Pseudogymnoascus sp. WSF 3629]|nr:hypothetical protein VE00_10891 [Pseudogymnoascus sp. WSF 3629]
MGPSQKVIAIIELCVYVPIFFLAAFVVFRHGFRRQLGWIYLVIFCGVRCAGGGFRIASEANPNNETDQEWCNRSFLRTRTGVTSRPPANNSPSKSSAQRLVGLCYPIVNCKIQHAV